MKILAIDSSAQVASVAIVDEHKTIGEFSTQTPKKHAQTLMPMVDALLQATGLTMADMDAVACAGGPGSFTGLRIGAATAKGLAHGAGKPVIHVPTLEALAYNVCDGEKLIVPMLDARRGQVYASFFQWEKERLVQLVPDTADSVEQILDKAAGYGRAVVCVGDGALACAQAITDRGFQVGLPHVNTQRAAAVGAVALLKAAEGGLLPYGAFTPVYVRLPQAQRERMERQSHD